MSLLNPEDDFVKRSIQSLKTGFVRLSFLGGLRGSSGAYHHWGLERTFGKEAAESAMGQVHTNVWLTLMKSRIQDLEKDSLESLGEIGKNNELPSDPSFVPTNTEGGTRRHYFFLVKTINQLLRHRR